MTQKIEISFKTIILTVALIIFIQALWIVRELFYALFLGLILMSALKPLTLYLEKNKIPRQISALVVLLSTLLSLSFIIFRITPPIINESFLFIKNLPDIISASFPTFSKYVNFDTIVQNLPNLPENIIKIISSIFSNLIFIVSIFFFTYYFIIEDDIVKKYFSRYFDQKKIKIINDVFTKIESRMGAWFWGEITLMTIIGVMTYIGLVVLGIKYALPLAVLAGFLEVVPNIGPTISAIPAIFVATTVSIPLGGITLLLYILIQQFENYLIVPLVMKKAVGLHPVVTLIALALGGKIGGFMGILLAVPIALAIETVIAEYLEIKKK